MSNSAAYRWTYEDEQARKRRELRVQLTEEVTRSRVLRGQAKAFRRVHRTAPVDVHIVTVPSRAEATELAAALESAREINRRAEAELSRAAASIWSSPPEENDRPSATRPAVPATAPAHEDRVAQARASALADAERLLDRDGPACDPDDLPVFARRLEALRQARSVDAARTLLTDLGVLVHRSALRQRNAVRTAALRAVLLDRLEDAEPQDRQRLAAAVADAPDPSALEDEVERAVARADLARSRAAVAARVMRALHERDYAVGQDFADLLAEEGSVVVPFGAAAGASGAAEVPDGYGLRVRLDADRELTTALVRAPAIGTADGGTSADPGAEADSRVQHWFCGDQLPRIEDAMGRQGVALDRTAVLPPGVLPTTVVSDTLWPETGRARDDQAADDRTRGTQARAPQKKPGPARPAMYPQERGRER
ncbi:hypothetical protein ABZZ36_39725 [Actinacidiphila glaucinigra]|uniref:hypothetical protein n=1 Tax=Actinacidiphila glaucinigra TaxID=235986 RepID=UPI0033A718DF